MNKGMTMNTDIKNLVILFASFIAGSLISNLVFGF